MAETPNPFHTFELITASAGAGKTHELTQRIVSILLSDTIKYKDLRNILAVTFTNNAAKEMRERVLEWLKGACLGEGAADPKVRANTARLCDRLGLAPDEVGRRAAHLIGRILDEYEDFQVSTIDSFMASVFKVSAIDFGFNPDFEIQMDGRPVIQYAFDRFLRGVRRGTATAALLEELIPRILELKDEAAAYLWDPAASVQDEVARINELAAHSTSALTASDNSAAMAALCGGMRKLADEIDERINRAGLKRHGNSSFPGMRDDARAGNFAAMLVRGMANPPVTKVKPGTAGYEEYERILGLWVELGALVRRYTPLYAADFYSPYVRIYTVFEEVLRKTKLQRDVVLLSDVTRTLAVVLTAAIVPDVYFRIGERVYHYLIDEFQDTSPLQWHNFGILLEEALSKGGSAFLVGDTKQAIYGFRGADYRIMKAMERENPFPSAAMRIDVLGVNRRSARRILAFAEAYFLDGIVNTGDELTFKGVDVKRAAALSGIDTCRQEPYPESPEGYVEAMLFERTDDREHERAYITLTLDELTGRGFRRGDIAILTQKNEDVVDVSTWLNDRGVPFISYSSLDVRRNKMAGELLALLKFLDSPRDNLAFATFLLGDIMAAALEADGNGGAAGDFRQFVLGCGKSTLYARFRERYGELWERYFASLFRSTGYLPLYDLVADAYKIFGVFTALPEQEACFVKILEVIRQFNDTGGNALRDFLKFSEDENADSSAWNIEIPKDSDAVHIMTVHKAKGLEFPVVIVLLYEPQVRPGYFTDESGGEISLLKINEKYTGADERLERIYRTRNENETVNILNSLYVAFTRAKSEMYVAGVRKSKKNEEKGDMSFVGLLPVGPFAPTAKPPVAKVPSRDSMTCVLRHDSRTLSTEFWAGGGPEREENARGTFIHAVLSHIVFVDETDLAAVVTAAYRKTVARIGISFEEKEIVPVVEAFLRSEAVCPLFAPAAGRSVRTEAEIADGAGRLYRVDRIVIDGDRVQIVDFKTGGEPEAPEAYRRQVANYVSLVQAVHPGKQAAGWIAYVDGGTVAAV